MSDKPIATDGAPPSGDGWNGTFTLNMQSNARHAIEEFNELWGFMESATYHEAPAAVRIAVSVAWVKAKESVALFRGCIADFTAPWFDGSAFPKSNRASDLGLKAGDDCPKCAGELVKGRHRFDQDGGHPDCDWLWCLDCNYQTDPE